MKKFLFLSVLFVSLFSVFFLIADVYAQSSIVGQLRDDCEVNGTCTLADLIDLVVIYYRGVLGIIGSIVLFWFVFGGVIMITSAGNSEKVKKGKDAIIGAAVGMILVLSSYLIVQFTLQTLGVIDKDGNFIETGIGGTWQQPNLETK